MKLEAFKALHGIEQLEFKTSKKTGKRVVVNTIIPIVISKDCKLNEELFIGEYHTKTSTGYDGPKIWSIHNESGWKDDGNGTL